MILAKIKIHGAKIQIYGAEIQIYGAKFKYLTQIQKTN